MDKEIQVLRAKSWDDYAKCGDLLRTIDARGSGIPPDVLRSSNEHGGLLLLALLHSQPVGLAFGHLALEGRSLHLHSDVLGVLPEHRHRGIGFLLKVRQREEALAQGLARIAWTLDPLQADHANLSFRKLGAHAGEYLRDYMGPRGDAASGPSGDRLWVEWDLDDGGVAARLQGTYLRTWEIPGTDVINATEPLVGGFREPRGVDLSLFASPLFLEIPWDLEGLGKERPGVARAWGMAVRRALEHYLSRGYRIVDAAVDRKYRRVFHVLAPVP